MVDRPVEGRVQRRLVQGKAKFKDLQLKVIDKYMLLATVTGKSATGRKFASTCQSPVFKVKQGPPAALTFETPGYVTAAEPFAVKVFAKDSGDNLIKSKEGQEPLKVTEHTFIVSCFSYLFVF